MPCFRPITAYRSADRGRSGKRLIIFDHSRSVGLPLQLPCGQCVGCRLERSRQWAMRCVHEASLYESNCFLTLTYDQEHLPLDGSLNKAHFQLFMKRLRSRFSEARIRYYHCGEYGEKFRRPHYHACLFNFDFLDKVIFRVLKDVRLYTSDVLDKTWGLGFSTIGEVTFESAAYVARYIMKKVNGDLAAEHYTVVDPSSGELITLQPEYTTMSRRAGIGQGWYDAFRDETYRDDFVIMRGKRMKPPRYYDSIYEVEDPEAYQALKLVRMAEAVKRKADNTPERLAVREKCKLAEVSNLVRELD